MKNPLPCFSVAISARKLIGSTICIVKWRSVIVSAYSNPVSSPIILSLIAGWKQFLNFSLKFTAK